MNEWIRSVWVVCLLCFAYWNSVIVLLIEKNEQLKNERIESFDHESNLKMKVKKSH